MILSSNRTRQVLRQNHYRDVILRELADGRERSSHELAPLLRVPKKENAVTILGRVKIRLVEDRSPWRLRRRNRGKMAFWSLEPRSRSNQ